MWAVWVWQIQTFRSVDFSAASEHTIQTFPLYSFSGTAEVTELFVIRNERVIETMLKLIWIMKAFTKRRTWSEWIENNCGCVSKVTLSLYVCVCWFYDPLIWN